jgi:DNA modification methylase
MSSLIEHADGVEWLSSQAPGSARVVVFDPPYSRFSPMRGREDGAAGSVARPFTFLYKALSACARVIEPKGIVICFADWELLGDLEEMASMTGLREQAHLAWIRSRPGGGGMFRGACDPVLIASRTPPGRVDRAALKNWFLADYEIPRKHYYSKPPELLAYIMGRVCRRGDLVLDPFAGGGSSRVAAESLKLDLAWRGADIDAAFAETSFDPAEMSVPPERMEA